MLRDNSNIPLLGESSLAAMHERNVRTAIAHAGVGFCLILPTFLVRHIVPDPLDAKNADDNYFNFSFPIAILHLASIVGAAAATFVIVIGVHFLSRDLPLLNFSSWLWLGTCLVLIIGGFVEMIALLELGREPRLRRQLMVWRDHILLHGFPIPEGLAVIFMGLSIMFELRRRAAEDQIASELGSVFPMWMGLIAVLVGLTYLITSFLPSLTHEFVLAKFAYSIWGLFAGALLLRHHQSKKN
mmetsp:Transcript_38260/g.120453  ORF Transcript_38260/g.120453 Transcript_38260/m.120453 type:complete len:242 (-) Transcript_38260:71-796(-)